MGINPFIDAEAPPPPTKGYKLTLKNTGQVIDVDPDNLPDEEGQKGSLLALLLDAGVEVDHVCGGVVAT